VLSIGKVITIFQRGFASLDRLNGILDIKPQIEDNGTVKTFPSSGSVKIQDLSFTYPGTQKKTLDDINIEIPEGHTLGIIGKTGSGKSTLANLLLKTFNVEDNKIFIGDTDINELKLNTLRGGFGYVPQDNFLFKASIIDNISFFEATYSDTDIEEAAKHSCIYQDIIMMPDGFETKVGERGVNLSGGQKQRISIARALVRNPEILILDDALSAVDTVTETKILHNLQEVRKGKTTIVIASRISTIMEADEIIVFDKGRICERGTHEQLLGKGGLYREIYDYQFSNETYLS
jgi:ATP-binding cassette subfamily B protein